MATVDWLPFVEPFARRPLVIDTNLLLLLIVGTSSRSAISRFSRTSAFSAEDFDAVQEIARYFAVREGLSTTPHVLTETSNFLGRREDLRLILRAFVSRVNEALEPAKRLANQAHFPRLGLTDAAVLDLAAHSHCVLTVDASLAAAIGAAGGVVVNYNHIRFPL